jgi:hypothetical protein
LNRILLWFVVASDSCILPPSVVSFLELYWPLYIMCWWGVWFLIERESHPGTLLAMNRPESDNFESARAGKLICSLQNPVHMWVLKTLTLLPIVYYSEIVYLKHKVLTFFLIYKTMISRRETFFLKSTCGRQLFVWYMVAF